MQVILFVVDVVNIASEIEALSASLINTITLIPGAYDFLAISVIVTRR